MNDRKNILVAEDNPALAAVIRFNLQRAGFEVTVAKNGKEALAKARRTDFDLVISDHQMPLMSGLELCEQLRQMPAYIDCPIIMLTAKAMEVSAEHLFQMHQILEVIPKPFSPAAIVEKAAKYLSVTPCVNDK